MRRILAWAAIAVLMTAAVQAAKRDTTAAEGYKIHVVTDRPEALYSVGDEAVFTITLKKDDAPVSEGKVSVSVTNDNAAKLDSKTMDLTGEPLTIKGTLDKPGFVKCQATYVLPSGKKIYALGGAGFDPEKIKPSLPPPDDFDAFWADQIAQLDKVPMNAKLVPVDSGNANVEEFDITIDCLGGAPVRGYFARPKGAKPKSLPALITLQSAGVKPLSKRSAAGYAGRGFLSIDINAHGIENDKPKEYYTELSKGRLKDYSHQGTDDRETIYFRGMYLRLYRAMEYLMAQPEWDGKVLGAYGSSQGGGQALAAAGLNPKVTFFGAGVPALCEHTGPVNGWPRFLRPERGGEPDPKVFQAVRYVDAMNFASRTKARAFVYVGFIDTTCRPTSVYAAYNNLKGPKRILNCPLMGHEWRRENYNQFLEMLKEEGKKSKGE